MYRLISVTMLGFFFAFMIGCSQFVEQDTPPGQIAPPVQIKSAQPYRNPNTQPIAQTSGSSPPAEVASASSNGKVQPLMSMSILSEFDNIYRKMGSPRLAIFLNRVLSDEVREWRTVHRGVVSMQGEFSSQKGEASESFKGPGGVAAYGQTHLSDRRRTSPEENWMWGFEEGFLGPFLEIGAKIVDRATIIRLTAADSGQQGSAYNPIAVKKVEMDSLKGKADLFIEILIRRMPGSKLGYVFKASAKEVNTGIIRANVTTRGWKYSDDESTEEKVAATDTGYHFVEGEAEQKMPEVDIVAGDLSLALMRSLSNSWR